MTDATMVNAVPDEYHVNSGANRPLLTSSRQWEGVNSVPNVPPLTHQQRRILDLAARPQGVTSREAVIAIGGDRIQYRPGAWRQNQPQIIGTRAARSVAASVSRCLTGLLKRGLLAEPKWEPRSGFRYYGSRTYRARTP